MAARTREKDLTAAQVKELTQALATKREELMDALKSRRSDSAKQETQRGTGDEADQASEDAETALETRLMDRDAKLLREVERALDKVKNNTYGLCEGTEEPIGYARLKLRPWTRYSVTYKEELEREQKRQGEG
ncbi:MAG: TraR/DksA family transcriptional regulator [Deltaproteobacteria bacterium]|nr:TraR/DksA family transcriptional regulator [Deltaproteobacteria bacterium]